MIYFQIQSSVFWYFREEVKFWSNLFLSSSAFVTLLLSKVFEAVLAFSEDSCFIDCNSSLNYDVLTIILPHIFKLWLLLFPNQPQCLSLWYCCLSKNCMPDPIYSNTFVSKEASLELSIGLFIVNECCEV